MQRKLKLELQANNSEKPQISQMNTDRNVGNFIANSHYSAGFTHFDFEDTYAREYLENFFKGAVPCLLVKFPEKMSDNHLEKYFKLLLAVSNVPKIYEVATGIKPIIRILKICVD